MNLLSLSMTFYVASCSVQPNFKPETRLVIHPMSLQIYALPNGRWLDMVDILKQIDESKINKLIAENKELFVDNTRLAHRLLTSVIRHVMNRISLNAIKLSGLSSVEKAVENRLSEFLDRLTTDIPDEKFLTENRDKIFCTTSSNVIETNFFKIETLKSWMTREGFDGDEQSEMSVITRFKESIESVIANQELEYLDTINSDARIAKVLEEIYALIDSSGEDKVEVLLKIVTMKLDETPVENVLNNPELGVFGEIVGPKTGILKELDDLILLQYGNCLRNKQTSLFLQFMFVRNLKLRRSTEKLSWQASEILKLAKNLKMKDLVAKVKRIVAGDHKLTFDHLEGLTPVTGIDMRNDKIFSTLRQNEFYQALENDVISGIEDAVSMWIDERVQLAIIRPEFDYFFRKLFDLYDDSQYDILKKMGDFLSLVENYG